jgi:transposase
MKYILGQDRNQTTIFPISLEQAIDQDNEVRIIDLFVDTLNIEKMGFNVDFGENGRPAYHPKDLLKLYIYGYLNKIRSSRDLEKETKRNIEVMWLIKGLSPDHNTISNFRRDNPKAIKKVFRATVAIARNFDLIGGKLLAGDSTKLRAQNSKKNNFNEKKIARHLEYIEGKLSEYEAQLSEADQDNQEIIKQEIEKHQDRKQRYQELRKQLKETSGNQISTSDPESRHMITRNNITEVAYNVQTTVDAENNIPIDYKVTNENDSKAMGKMLRRAKAIVGNNEFTALYDKGYHTGSEFKTAADLCVEVLVAIPKVAANAPNPDYNVEHFKYDNEKDLYICPNGENLYSNGNWYKSRNALFRQFKTPACKSCPVRSDCTKARQNGKIIQRSEFQQYINNNKERIEQNKNYYRRRQAIVEHPYGTIKRQWGFSYIMTKKFIKRAEADVGLIFTVYNLRRIINLVGISALQSYFRETLLIFFAPITSVKPKISLLTLCIFLKKQTCYFITLS